MKNSISEKQNMIAEKRMNAALLIVDKKGGFNNLSKKELRELKIQSNIVAAYDDANCYMPLPESKKYLKPIEKFINKLDQKKQAIRLSRIFM